MTIDILVNESPKTPEEYKATQAVEKFDTVGVIIERALDGHDSKLSEIRDAVEADDLTKKAANEERLKAGQALRKNLQDLSGQLVSAEGELEAALHSFENPLSEEEKRTKELEKSIENGLKDVLYRQHTEGLLSQNDRLLVSNQFVRKELKNLTSTMHRQEIRGALLNAKKTTISEPANSGHGFQSKILSPHEFRLHIYKQALAVDDDDTISVCENVLNEAQFFDDGKDKKWKVLSDFL